MTGLGFNFILIDQLIPRSLVIISAHSNSWMVVLDPMKPGGPYEVMAQQTLGRTNITLRVHDVLFGDVWLCSGQSNMQMTVSQVIYSLRDNKYVDDEEEKGGGGRRRGGRSLLFHHVPGSVLSIN